MIKIIFKNFYIKLLFLKIIKLNRTESKNNNLQRFDLNLKKNKIFIKLNKEK